MNSPLSVTVRPLVEADLDEADRISRVAFGTYLGAPDPQRFFGSADFVRTRWRADPEAAFAAEADGRLVGSNIATNWGSVGFFGPLTVDPGYWDRGIAKQLMKPTMELFARWGTRHTGLFTFADSARHVGLYQHFGFWPRFLTALMSRPVEPLRSPIWWAGVSAMSGGEYAEAVKAVGELTDAIYPGLDVTREIDAVRTQRLGETILISDRSGVQAVAVCHIGPGTEAGDGTCYVKFGAVRPGESAPGNFSRLIDACQALAADRGVAVIVAGANAGRDRAWKALIDHGFRTSMQGIAMHRPNEAGYSESGVYVIEDWR